MAAPSKHSVILNKVMSGSGYQGCKLAKSIQGMQNNSGAFSIAHWQKPLYNLIMTKLAAYLKIAFAVLLYIISALTFVDYIYSLLIPDTVTAIENAFGKLAILIFMLVLAKFSLAAGKAQLNAKQADGTEQAESPSTSEDSKTNQLNSPESKIQASGKEADE